MGNAYDISKMLAGVAFFLLSMNFMEASLHYFAGRRFKLFLKRHTGNKGKAVIAATGVTGLLQSSSVVNLLVLSMVGAGILQMENALALILGSNLGSTLNSWLVAGVGFHYDIDIIAMPLAGIAGIGMAFARSERAPYAWFKFFFSLAFLFIALGFIKSGMQGFVEQTDLSVFTYYPLVVFGLMGIALTTIVQSSAATMALTLSALYAHAISMPAAMGIVLGSEIGTTLKLFPASIKGSPEKKRLALANFLFNLLTVCILLPLVRPVNGLISEQFGIHDPLIALVVYQTLINLVSLFLFLPLLRPVSRFLLRCYKTNATGSHYISKVPAAGNDMALEALDKETGYFISLVMSYGQHIFDLPVKWPVNTAVHKKFQDGSAEEQYAFIKQLHGEMHGYYLQVLNDRNGNPGVERLDPLIAAIRNSMYAAKNIRDIRMDIDHLRNSSNESKYNYYLQSRQKLEQFYNQVIPLLEENRPAYRVLTELQESITRGYMDSLKQLYRQSTVDQVSESDITTFINFNRELYTSFKSIVFGLKEYLLTPDEAAFFDGLPGFIR